MPQDWLHDLYLRWTRRSVRRPRRSGITVEALETRLTPALTVQVYEDWNSNGQADFGDPGLAGVAVLVDVNGNGAADFGEPRGFTNGSGQFTAAGAPTGTYPVVITAPTGYAVVPPGSASQLVTIAVGGSATASFGLIHKNSVYGTAYADANRNGVREPSEGGVAGIAAYLDVDGNGKYDPPTKIAVTATDPVPIFDLQTSVSPVVVTGAPGKIAKVTLTVDILHTYDSDLDASLVAPDGTVVPLFSGVGASGDDFTGTTFDDAAGVLIDFGAAPFTGTFQPEGQLSRFNGRDANGTWKLVVSDNFFQDEGEITDWTLNVTTSSGDQLVTTGPGGRFRFDAAAGTYKVGLIPTQGYAPTSPPDWTDLLPVTLAKNAAVTGNDFGLFADAVPPVVTGFTRLDKSPVNADQVRYQVRFSEPVLGLKPAAFGVNTVGLAGGAVDSVTGSGTVYTVTVSSLAGDGDIQLVIPDPTAITDTAGNPLVTPVPAAPTYTIDRSPPQSTITTPAAQVYTPATWPGAIGGTASDAGSGLTAVLVSVRQPGTGLYWDGSVFGSPTELFTAAVGRATWTLPFPVADLGTVEGPYIVHVTGLDAAGNRQATPTELQFGFDIGPPSVAVTPDATPLNDNPIRFALAFSEPVTAPDPARLTVTGGTLSGVVPTGGQVGVFASKYQVVVTPTGDGPVTLAVAPGAAADVASNPSSGGGAAVTYDGTRPTVTVNGSADLAVTAATWAGQLTGTAADNLTGVAVLGVAVLQGSTGKYWDGTGFAAAAPVYLPTAGTPAAWKFAFPTADFPVDDNYQFLVRGADAAGNVTTAPVAVAFDNQAPAPAVATPAAAPVNAAAFDKAGRLTGTAADAVSGPAATAVAIQTASTNLYWDGAAFASPTPVFLPTTGTPANWAYIGLPADKLIDGAYTITVRTTDRAGNVGSATRAFSFDNTATIPVVDFPNGGTGYNPATWESASQLNGHVIDTNDTVATRVAVRRLSDGLYWNGSYFGSVAPVFQNTTGTPAHWQYAFASSYFPDEGRYEVTATSTDAAGNVGSTATQFSFDRTPPASAVTLPGGAQFNLTSWPGAVTGTASDNLSGVTRVRLSVRQVDGGRYWDGAGFTSATEVLFDAAPTGGASPSGPLGSWTYPFPVADFNADGSYVVSSYATDGAGITQQFAATAVIRIDRTPPTGEVVPAGPTTTKEVGSSRVDLQACKLEYSIVSPK